MKPSEVAKLLAKAALIDNRTVDEMTVTAWHELIGHLDARDAMAALTLHRQRSDVWLLPAHIVALSKETRRDREHDENAARAKQALPAPDGKPMPAEIRAILDRLGKGPFAAAKTPPGAAGPGDDARPSEGPQKAAQDQTTENAR